MSNNISLLNKNIQKLHEWLESICANARLEDFDQEQAFIVLRHTLHQIRDNLPLNNLVHFSAQLPVFIKGLLFEQWDPNMPLLREKQPEEFLESIYQKLPERLENLDLETAVMAVFKTLYNKINPEEMEKLGSVFPKGVKELMY